MPGVHTPRWQQRPDTHVCPPRQVPHGTRWPHGLAGLLPQFWSTAHCGAGQAAH